RKRARPTLIRAGIGNVNSHDSLIGKPRASLERGTCPGTVPGRVLAGVGAVSWHEELAMRALETAVPLGLAGDQLGREGLLAVRADDLLGLRLGVHLRHVPKVPTAGRSGTTQAAPVRVPSGRTEATRGGSARRTVRRWATRPPRARPSCAA